MNHCFVPNMPLPHTGSPNFEESKPNQSIVLGNDPKIHLDQSKVVNSSLADDQSAPGSAVQAEITRNALDSLKGYPIAASLLRPDLLTSLSNLTIGSPISLVDDLISKSLEPFTQSLSIIDGALHQGPSSQANQSEIISGGSGGGGQVQRDWVERQIQIANRIIHHFDHPPSSHASKKITSFKKIPANPIHQDPSSSSSDFYHNDHPQPSPGPTTTSNSSQSSESIKAFYDSFINSTLSNQRSFLNSISTESHPKHCLKSSSPSSPPPPPQQQQQQQQQEQKQLLPQQPQDWESSPSLVPQPNLTKSLPHSFTAQDQSIPIQRQDSSSPDPLDMNLRARSRPKNARSHPRSSLGQEQYQTPPLKKSKSNPKTESPALFSHTQNGRPPIAPIALPLSLPPIITKTCPLPQKIPPNSNRVSQNLKTPRAKNVKKPVVPRSQDPPKDAAARLLTLTEDILEADDLGPDSHSEFFSCVGSEAILSPDTLTNLTSLIDQSDGQAISQLLPADLGRLMRILGRGVSIVEELIIIPPQLKQKPNLSSSNNHGNSLSDAKKSTNKKLEKSSKSQSKRALKPKKVNAHQLTNVANEEDICPSEENESGDGAPDESSQHVVLIEQRLKDFVTCLHSVNAALSFLVRDRYLPKQFCSEELVQSIMVSVKSQLSGAIYPFIEAEKKETSDPYLEKLNRIISCTAVIFNQISSSFSFISTSILPKIDVLVDRMELSESILIHVGYIAVGPFSVDPGPLQVAQGGSGKAKKSGQGNGPMKNMRLGCLKLLKTLSSKYPDHRNWMVEEILSSVVNLPEQSNRNSRAVYHLPNGKSIQTVSALLLHIVQCCLSGSRAHATSIINSAGDLMLKDDELETEGKSRSDDVSALIRSPADRLKENIETGMSSATRVGMKIISFLLQKSGKSAKSTHEASYRLVLDRLTEDLINLLFLPDWPVAEFMLGLCCKTMVGLLEGNKVSADSNAIKSLCLDQLGPITARLIEPLEGDDQDLEPQSPAFSSFKSMIKSFDRPGLSRFFNSQKSVLIYLDTISHTDNSFTSAADFTYGSWMLELINNLKIFENMFEGSSQERDSSEFTEKDGTQVEQLLGELRSRVEEFAVLQCEPSATVQNRHLSDGFPESLREGGVNERISRIQGLKGLTEVFLERILLSSASSSATFRSKAIKALGLVVAKDPTVFFKDSVRNAIENRMLDSSPSVRDATIELLGKYVVSRPDLAVAFLPQLSARIADKGLSVRRRVVKLLKSIYTILSDEDWIELKVEISHKLISRIHDEEISIKSLAMNSIEELWFSHSASKPFNPGLTGSLIMKIAAGYRDLPSPVESVMKFIFNQCAKKGQSILDPLIERCREVVEHLIDQLMDVAAMARDSNFNEVECIKTICTLSSSSRKLLHPNKALMLLPYLKGATTPSEQAVVQHLLKLFRACALEAPKSSGTFGQRLQSSLLVLVNKPNLNAGGTILQELIACFCTVVKCQTHDYRKLLDVFKACEKRLRDQLDQLEIGSGQPNLKALPLLMYLVSTLAAYGGMDQIPANNESVCEEFRAISSQPVHLHVYNILVRIYFNDRATKLRSVAIICLGFLYRSYPTLMTRAESLKVMDSVFDNASSSDVELQHRLIKVIAEFIGSQAERLGSEDDKNDAIDVDMNQLIGNCEGFEDSGVSSAIVQRYLGHITSLAQSIHPHIQKIAVDIISYTIKQGLAHPLECVPVLVALESSSEESLSKRVFGLHRLLHVQRANLVHSRFLATMEKVFEYHSGTADNQSLAPGYVGVPPRSVMGPWYQLLNEKRSWKIDFLKALVKQFSVDPQNEKIDMKALRFVQYLAEGLLTLDFKTEEELLVLIEGLNESIGQYAYQTLNLLEGDQTTSLIDLNANVQGQEPRRKYEFNLIAFRACTALGLAFVLRDLLKELFGISDQKLSIFTMGLEKAKIKKIRESLAHRKIGLEETCRKFEQDLKLKLPGLSGSEEAFDEQVTGFAKMVREDFEVRNDEEPGFLDEDSGPEHREIVEDGLDDNMHLD